MLHLIGAVHIEIHGLRALFQLTHRKLQLLHGRGDPLRKPEVHKYQQENGEDHHEHGEQQKLAVVVPQCLHRHHAHQLPAGVAHGLDRHLPPLGLELLRVCPVGIGRGGQIVLLLQARVDQLLTGMVNDFAAPVDQVKVSLPVGEGHFLADLLDAAEAHVHQQHAALHDAAA